LGLCHQSLRSFTSLKPPYISNLTFSNSSLVHLGESCVFTFCRACIQPKNDRFPCFDSMFPEFSGEQRPQKTCSSSLPSRQEHQRNIHTSDRFHISLERGTHTGRAASIPIGEKHTCILEWKARSKATSTQRDETRSSSTSRVE
jgi:hypothetical protein